MDDKKQPGIELSQVVLERAVFEHREDYLQLPPTTPIPGLPIGWLARFGTTPDGKRAVVRVELVTDRSKNPLYVIELVMVALIKVVEGQENMPLDRYARFNSV